MKSVGGVIYSNLDEQKQLKNMPDERAKAEHRRAPPEKTTGMGHLVLEGVVVLDQVGQQVDLEGHGAHQHVDYEAREGCEVFINLCLNLTSITLVLQIKLGN